MLFLLNEKLNSCLFEAQSLLKTKKPGEFWLEHDLVEKQWDHETGHMTISLYSITNYLRYWESHLICIIFQMGDNNPHLSELWRSNEILNVKEFCSYTKWCTERAAISPIAYFIFLILLFLSRIFLSILLGVMWHLFVTLYQSKRRSQSYSVSFQGACDYFLQP